MKKQVINSTGLRYQTSRVVNYLKEGGSFYLVHRSSIIGKIEPSDNEELKTFDVDKFLKIVEKLNLKENLTERQIKTRYLNYLKKRYAKNLS
ncbi:MAG: hypothetical protein Fur009_0180 [Candidatus Microgenomates bacterium]